MLIFNVLVLARIKITRDGTRLCSLSYVKWRCYPVKIYLHKKILLATPNHIPRPHWGTFSVFMSKYIEFSISDTSNLERLTNGISRDKRDDFIKKYRDGSNKGQSLLMEYAQAAKFPTNWVQ